MKVKEKLKVKVKGKNINIKGLLEKLEKKIKEKSSALTTSISYS